MGRPNWPSARRVLCVRLDALGDVLMTTPALRALAQSAPGRQIVLLTSPSGAAAARYIPYVIKTIVYEAPWMKATPGRDSAETDLALIRRLAGARFDAAVIFTVFSQNPLPAALTCYLAGIPLRLAHCREPPYQLLTDWIADEERTCATRHEVQRQLDLVACVGATTVDTRLAFRVPSRAQTQVDGLLQAAEVDPSRPWLAMHPGATAPSRRYPAESFAQAADLLAREGYQIAFTGSADEAPLVEQVRGAMRRPSCSLAGRLDLGQLAAVLLRAPLLIANNTGPAHLAAAVGTPVVDLYALTNPQHTPWGVPHRTLFHDVPCKNCYKSVCPEGHHDCLRRVSPRVVAAAALELLSQRREQVNRVPIRIAGQKAPLGMTALHR